MIKLYNTLTRKKEELKPIHKDWVGLYTCGPTVYNFAHIGNLRTYVFEDVLEKTLRYGGHEVRRVMNITDVGHLTGDSDTGEDKLDKEARAKKQSVEEIAQFYTDAFFEDLKKLNIVKPDIIAPASKFTREQVAVIETLFQRGLAYQTENAVYFDVSKLKDYGKLSGQSLKEKTVGARSEVVVDKEKRNPADFALWFKLTGKFKNHLLHWPSPWGEGFPGWHIECSAISRHFLGQPFDIHTGGVDHIGTHHTNEIAQSEGAFGVPLAHIWMHGEFLLIDTKKMAKSENNFFVLKDIEKRGLDPITFRYLTLGTHYRSPLNFSWEALAGAQNALGNVQRQFHKLSKPAKTGTTKLSKNGISLREKFAVAVNDDLNTPQALAVLHEALDSIELPENERYELASDFDKILGINGKPPKIPEKVKKLAEERESFRTSKQFVQSDRLRDDINALGYEIEDTPQGPFLWPKNQT